MHALVHRRGWEVRRKPALIAFITVQVSLHNPHRNRGYSLLHKTGQGIYLKENTLVYLWLRCSENVSVFFARSVQNEVALMLKSLPMPPWLQMRRVDNCPRPWPVTPCSTGFRTPTPPSPRILPPPPLP